MKRALPVMLATSLLLCSCSHTLPNANGSPKIMFADSSIEIDKSNWLDVFSASLGRVWANQGAFAELGYGAKDWRVDLDEGTIYFGSERFPVQFLGSQSYLSNTWLWGWENINNFQSKVIKTANSVKRIGETWNLEQFTIPKQDITDTLDGYMLAIVTASICSDKVCYYRCKFSEDGAAFVVFSGIPDEVFAPVDAMTFMKITMQCIQQYTVNHRIFIESFLYQNNTSYSIVDDSIIAHFKSEDSESDLRIDFEKVDDSWRISDVHAVLGKS